MVSIVFSQSKTDEAVFDIIWSLTANTSTAWSSSYFNIFRQHLSPLSKRIFFLYYHTERNACIHAHFLLQRHLVGFGRKKNCSSVKLLWRRSVDYLWFLERDITCEFFQMHFFEHMWSTIKFHYIYLGSDHLTSLVNQNQVLSPNQQHKSMKAHAEI